MALSLDGTTGITSDGGTPVIENLDTTATGITVTGQLTTTGNVGIGTNSPDSILQVSKASTSTSIGGSTSIAKIVNTQGTLLNETAGIEFFNRSVSGSAKLAGVYGLYEDYNATGYAGALVFATETAGASNVAERMRIDSAGNVGIGTSTIQNSSSGRGNITLGGSSSAIFNLSVASANSGSIYHTGSEMWFHNRANGPALFFTNDTERARIDSSGNLLVGTTSSLGTLATATNASGFIYGPTDALVVAVTNNSSNAIFNRTNSNTTGDIVTFRYNGTGIGTIRTNGTSTSYNTTSDYRLKEDWVAVADASTRVNALKPVNFAWISSGKRVDGFLAHELAEVVPEAVTGVKDAVDAEGKPVYQGIDQSKLVPLLTAALQEALAAIESLTARISALES